MGIYRYFFFVLSPSSRIRGRYLYTIFLRMSRDDNQLRGHHFFISTKTLRFRQASALAYFLQSLTGVLLSLVLESLRLVGLNRIFLRIGISFYYILTAFQFSKDLDCKIFPIFSIILATDTRQSTCLNRP
jgi:hypothetical protein